MDWCLTTFSGMYVFLQVFLALMLIYHIVHTGIVWGWAGDIDPVIFSSMKEIVWFVFVLVCVRISRHTLRRFLIDWKWTLLAWLLLVGWSLGWSWRQWSDAMNMIVGFKYDILPLVLLVTGIRVWSTLPQLSSQRLWKDMYRLLAIAVRGGILWQGAKLLFPEFFAHRWYGPVGDYVLDQAPPLYYRTGPDGWMRWQGVFSWPNNYGFFLVGYASLLILPILAKNKWGITIPWTLLLLGFIGSLIATFSRGALIGVGVQLVVLMWILKPQWKKRILALMGAGLFGIGVLSILKWSSTYAHLLAQAEGRQAFLAHPWWYGLGSAWPAVHWAGIYLPENHYLQLLLDIGWVGLVLWLLVVGTVYRWGMPRLSSWFSEDVALRLCLLAGLTGLLVEWLFLHVFEDSMVSYLFLLVLGVVRWIHYHQSLSR